MHIKTMLKKSILLFLFFVSGLLIHGQGENLKIKIAVMGPGDELYFWWGHIGLIIEDSARGTSDFYDYGLFDFTRDHFFYNFAFGRLLYSCGMSPTEWNIYDYTVNNRDITIYTLDLLPEKRIEIRDFAEMNVLPAFRDYYYHHFKDNCSTRIRDIIDLATDGQFYSQYGSAPGRFTLREHVRRHTWFSPSGDWFLSFIMGQDIDTPITVWEEMFLPSEVGNRIDGFWYTDSNNEKRKLVTSVEIINKPVNRPEVLDTPIIQWKRELLFSIAAAAVIGVFFFLQFKKVNAGKILSGIGISLCGIFFGAAGILIYFMGLFTNHDYSYHNMNMIFCTPLLIALVPFGICYASAKETEKMIKYNALVRLIWLISLTGIFVSMLLKLFPGFYQQNLGGEMLMLPLALVFVFQPAGLKDVFQRYLKPLKRSKA